MESKEIRFKSHGDMNELPQEMIEEILVRLPVKSIERCKCVSKSWRSLISSPHFIKAHLEESLKDKSLGRHRMIVSEHLVQANQCLSPSFLHEPLATTAAHIDYPTYGRHDYGLTIGFCNGLVCLLKRWTHFILWNPSTRKFRELPSPLDDKELSLSFRREYAYGFGFDESNDDHKVFVVLSFMPYGVGSRRLAKIYSSKTDSWRRVEVPATFDPRFEYGMGIFVSGKLHWQIKSDNEWDIVSFDLESEVSEIVKPPQNDCVLTDPIDGCLCCYSLSLSEPDHLDCWLLKEYGVKDSWYKFATLVIPHPMPSDGEDDDDEEEDVYFRPLLVGPRGEILAWYQLSFFALYLKEDGRYSSPSVRDPRAHDPTVYVESLVEP